MAQAKDLGNGAIQLPSGLRISPQSYYSQWGTSGLSGTDYGKQQGLSPADASALATWTTQNVPEGTYAQWTGYKFDGTAGGPPAPELGPLEAAKGEYTDTVGRDTTALEGLAGTSSQVGNANFDARAGIRDDVTAQGVKNAAYQDKSLGLDNAFGGYAAGLTAEDQARTAQYGVDMSGYTSQNNKYMSDYGDLYGQLATPLQSGVSWAGDLTSQGAQAYADPASIAAQNQALGQLQGTASGALDYQSQGAQAYADPQAVAEQQQGLDQLWSISHGSLNVKPGDLDPGAYAAQQDALKQYGALTTPEVTSQERFIYEQARQQQEQDERASRGASLSNMRQRGVGGGAAELVDSSLANQNISQNRLLSDLGAQSTAVQRSMAALSGYAGTAGQMEDQANALGTANSNRSANAAGQYAQGTDALRNETFDESYKRGVAADDASAHNQATRLQGQVSSGQLATDMRNASFDEAYKRGVSADNMSQYNRTSSIGVAEYNANFNQQERDAQWQRGTDYTNAGLKTDELNAANTGRVYDAGTHLSDTSYNRAKDVTGAYQHTYDVGNADDNEQTDRSIVAHGQDIDAFNGYYNRASDIVHGQVAIDQWGAGGRADIDTKEGGSAAAGKAADDAEALAEKNKKISLLWGLYSG